MEFYAEGVGGVHGPSVMINSASSQKEILAELASTITSYLEIGVQEGQSLRVVVQRAPYLRRLALCDTWGKRSGGTDRGSHEHIETLLTQLGYHHTVEFLDGDSAKLVPKLDELFDLVHVDGDHSFESCLADLKNGWVRCTQALVVHDASFDGVHKALFEFGKEHAEEIVETSVMFAGHGTMVFRRAV